MSKKDKFAVVLVGRQNSGKTTTIKHFDSMYDEWTRTKKQCKSGWRHLKLHKDILDSLITWIFFVPASPTETGKSVKKRIGKQLPDLMLIAEQVDKGGKHNKYSETMSFLESKGYEVVELFIGDDAKSALWKKWNESKFDETMKRRAQEIGDLFRGYIKRKIR